MARVKHERDDLEELTKQQEKMIADLVSLPPPLPLAPRSLPPSLHRFFSWLCLRIVESAHHTRLGWL